MNNFEVISKELDEQRTYIEKEYTNSQQDKEEVERIQIDISYKLDKILENSDTMTKDEIIQLMIKITKINTLIAMIK